jgi:drug/metabolite transporter (DMT)-like permease
VARALLINPVVIALAAALGVGVCFALGINPHFREMSMAVGICMVSSELAILPVLLNEKLLRAHISQAALLGTIVHLMLATMMAAIILLWLRPPLAFVYWLLALYWLTLIAISAVFVKILRQTPTHAVT